MDDAAYDEVNYVPSLRIGVEPLWKVTTYHHEIRGFMARLLTHMNPYFLSLLSIKDE